MKKFIQIIAIFFLLVAFFLKTAVAQTPSAVPTTGVANPFENLAKSSIDCGNLNQQCCDLSKLDFPQVSINLPAPFDVITSPFNVVSNFFMQNIAKPFVTNLKEFIFQTLDVQNNYCRENTKPSDLINPANCYCVSEDYESVSRLCSFVSSNEKSSCLSCVTTDKGIWTAIGCVQSDLGTFISQKLLGWGVGLAGIIAMLCIIYSAFQLQTSQGNPEKIKKAQELLTSCIMGLMLIIFSVFILRLIGVDILRIPGFG